MNLSVDLRRLKCEPCFRNYWIRNFRTEAFPHIPEEATPNQSDGEYVIKLVGRWRSLRVGLTVRESPDVRCAKVENLCRDFTDVRRTQKTAGEVVSKR